MAAAITPRLVEATFKYPINANSNPTPAKTPSQGAYTQVVRSPPVVQTPHYIAASQEEVVQDSLELPPPIATHQPKPLPNLLEPHTPIDTDRIVQDSHEPESLASAPSSQHHPDRQRSIEPHPPDQGLSGALQAEGTHSTTSFERTGTSQPEVSATTALTTPSMAPKASTSKGTSKRKPPANQSQKRARTSRTSLTSQLPTSEIINKGETSSSALLQKMKSGATSQRDVRRQVLEPAPPVAPTKPPQKASAPPSQAPTKNSSAKPSQQSQKKAQNTPKRQLSRDAELSEHEIDEYTVPQSDKKKDAKPVQKTRPAASSVPPVNKGKSRSRKQTAKAPVTNNDDDDDDEEYQSPKASKSRAAARPKRETRASTRAQAEKAIKRDGLKVSARNRTSEAAKTAEKPMPQQPPTLRASRTPKAGELENDEHSVPQVSSSHALRLQPAARQRPATPPAEKRKPRPVTERGAKLMHAISSPSQTDPAIPSVAIKTKQELPAAEHRFFTPAETPISEQGTTQRHPITVEDDGDESDDDDDVNAGSDDNYNELITQEMSQEEAKKQDIPEEPSMHSPFKDARRSPGRYLAASTHQARLGHFVEDHDIRKPHVVAFNDTGPKNQGVSRHKHHELDRPLAFEKDTSSPGPGSSDAHEPPPIDTTAHYDDLPVAKLIDSAGAPDTSVHVSTVGQFASVEFGDSALSRPKSPKAMVRADVSTPNNMAPPAIPRKAAAGGKKRKYVEETNDPIEESSHNNATTRIVSEVAENPTQVPSRPSVRQYEMPLHKPKEKEVAARLSAVLITRKTSTEPHSLNDQIALGSKRPEVARPQPGLDLSESSKSMQPAYEQPKPNRRSLDHPKPPSITNVYKDSADIDREPEAVASNKPTPLLLEKKGRSRPNAGQSETPVCDRKRSPIEMTKEPAKRQRVSTRGSHQPPGLSTKVANPLVGKLYQVADNGYPIPFGEEIPQETDLIRQTRPGDASLLPAMVFTQGSVVDPFTQIMASKHHHKVEKERFLEEVPNMQQEWPIQASQAIAHAGFEGVPQLTTSSAQRRQPRKDRFPTAQGKPRRGANVAHKQLGLVDALRLEIIPQAGVQDDKEGSKEDSQADEAMEEYDPDKTLVNEMSDDGDGDDDDSESGESSGSDDDDKAQDVLSVWRKALKSHQGDVYDQMVRIAHRLTVHLKDHETAIEDISKDYRQDGAKLIERFDKDNEERLEQYCIRGSKMKGALVLGFKQVSGILQKDVKDITMSSDRYGKMLQKQVDAGGRLEQIMQAYHP